MRLRLRLGNKRNVSNDTDRRQFFTLDRFGRTAEQGWRDCDGEMDVAGYNYRCDRNSDRLVRENDQSDQKDEGYRCDKLNRLEVFHRGDLDEDMQAIPVADRIGGQARALRSSGASPPDPSPSAGQGKGRRNRRLSPNNLFQFVGAGNRWCFSIGRSPDRILPSGLPGCKGTMADRRKWLRI